MAARHNLAALLQEKPFAGVNGSGKHNNWSLWTDTGVNLLAPDKLNSASGNPAAFPTVMAAIVRAVDAHGDMMRSAIASPGNDFRLGACEAPPAILSAYLGEDMTGYLEKFMDGEPVRPRTHLPTPAFCVVWHPCNLDILCARACGRPSTSLAKNSSTWE